MHSQIADQNLAVHARHFACLHSGSARAAAGNPVLRITCSSQSASLHSQSDNETFDRARGKKQLGSCFRKPSINRSALHAEQCAACNALFALTTRVLVVALHSFCFNVLSERAQDCWNAFDVEGDIVKLFDSVTSY